MQFILYLTAKLTLDQKELCISWFRTLCDCVGKEKLDIHAWQNDACDTIYSIEIEYYEDDHSPTSSDQILKSIVLFLKSIDFLKEILYFELRIIGLEESYDYRLDDGIVSGDCNLVIGDKIYNKIFKLAL